jgi:hypothetical protein
MRLDGVDLDSHQVGYFLIRKIMEYTQLHATPHVCSFSDQMPKFFISFDEVDQLGV